MSHAAPLVLDLVPAPDPLETCARFVDLPFVLFLDSATDPEHLGRYSFLAADPTTVVRSKGALTQELDPAGRWTRVATDPLARVRELVAPFATQPVRGLPPFQGGAAGYIGYDWGAMLERIPRPRYDDLAIPDVMLGLYDWVIAWDHPARHAWVISTGIPERGTAGEQRAVRRLAAVKRRLADRRTGGPADWLSGMGPVRRSGGTSGSGAPEAIGASGATSTGSTYVPGGLGLAATSTRPASTLRL